MIDGAEKIVSNVGNEIIYEIDKISFNKSHFESNSGESFSIIKFKAANLKIIFKK